MTILSLLPSLSCKLSAQSKKAVQNRVLTSQFGNGYSQVTKDGINSNIDKWDLTFIPLSGLALSDANSFFDLVGCDAWFGWLPLGETVIKKFRVDKDSLQKTMINFTTYIINVKITQCFDQGGTLDTSNLPITIRNASIVNSLSTAGTISILRRDNTSTLVTVL